MTSTATTTDLQTQAIAIAEARGYEIEIFKQAGDCWDVRLRGTGAYDRRRDVAKVNIATQILRMVATAEKGLTYEQARVLSFEQAIDLLNGEADTVAPARTFAVKGTARTAAGLVMKTYTSKNGTKAEAEGMLTDLEGVQERAGIAPNVRIIEVDADGNEVVPAERTVPGVGLQRVHVIDPETGKPTRLLTYPGTEVKARAYAALQVMHPTHPDWDATVARLHGK